ncbi:MAG TPA: hypothetical protein VEZ89_17375 [Rubrivivax sp.]|nr:hypothetical protein [Rubrivivax sp.]
MNIPLLYSLMRFDKRRPGIPGEHWATLGMGVSLLMSVSKRRSTLAKTAAFVAGAALIYRAASGHDGLRRLKKMR